MKSLIILSATLFLCTINTSYARGGSYSYHAHSYTGQHSVNSYTRSNGSHVRSHMQTNPNNTRNDNWTTRGNINPYIGKPGTRPRDGR